MAIADPKKLWPKLEKDGVEEVRIKLAMGVYANYKIPLIREWLLSKENEQNQPAHTQLDLEENISDKGIKNILIKSKYILIEFWRDQWKPMIGALIVAIIIAILL